jgi:sugar lactone lactonase YvrE
VFGQPNFFTSAPNNGGVNANSLNQPEAVAVDSTGNLYVADTANNRVLEYNTPFANGTTADLVFGQANNFGTKVCRPISASSLCNPLGVAVDSLGNVYVSDSNNNRVLEYNTPLTTDTVANRVVGQVNFVSGLANQGLATPTANGLTNPWGVALDSSDKLYVADNGNSRALEYNKPITNNEPASKVFGQGGVFNTGTANKGGLSATSLNFPQGIAVDKANSVYIVDKSNNRTLKYLSPLATDVTADKVFGQNNLFDQGGCGFSPSPTSLCVPDGVAVDSAKNLYVVDGEDHRILQYLAP